MYLRDKLIAHRVNRLETWAIVVFVRPNGELIHGGHGWSKHDLPTRRFASQVKELAEVAHVAVMLRANVLAPKVEKQAPRKALGIGRICYARSAHDDQKGTTGEM